ncbi:hypothetical protein PF005_g22833 [Phytophthora fragariae]|uniref:Uncharacterized protein n=1 Tax=Phytophthora fragariae TaxID=53985 RepID=A0A6A3IK09_9STRA|nr:hypothetical protein PF003_g2322 [Phytophthora fragariae]KAE8922627.1 hypothetical protein PF009_g27109 [Phytophthora fragariae]KAE8982400.1 hypothetical protein PF011_g21629 [Phytophthora fragariae]KAE9080907.1 hypothetical protein PF007_g22856 [Phytophthora fragariae]KAE9103885.1 hypothetical protein PF006_g22051 [Phytophthora fragariae]
MPPKRPSTLVPSWDSSKETTVPRQKMKAPDLEDGEEKGSEPRWSEAALEFAYNRQELQKFIDRDPVLQILRPRQIGTPKGPVAAPTASENKLDLVKGLLSLLKETGLVASPFDADELFDLDVEVIRSSARGLFGKLKSLVGEIPTDQDPTILTSDRLYRVSNGVSLPLSGRAWVRFIVRATTNVTRTVWSRNARSPLEGSSARTSEV